MKGTFRDGKFSRCGDYPNGYPQCIGRANAYGENYREMGNDRCTCVSFSTAEMSFAREHGLTIDGHGELPREWRDRRSRRDSELEEARGDARKEALDEMAWVRDEAARIVEARENRSLDRRGLASAIRRMPVGRPDSSPALRLVDDAKRSG